MKSMDYTRVIVILIGIVATVLTFVLGGPLARGTNVRIGWPTRSRKRTSGDYNGHSIFGFRRFYDRHSDFVG